MRLKVLTTCTLVLGVLLLFAWPFVLGPRPPEVAPKIEIARYAQKMLLFFGATASLFVMAAFFAWLVVRQARRQYLEETRENLGTLVEGTLQDHARKSD